MKNILPLLLFSLFAFSCSQKVQPVLFDVAAAPTEAAKPGEAEIPEPPVLAEKKVHKAFEPLPSQIQGPKLKPIAKKEKPLSGVAAHAKKVHKLQRNNSGPVKSAKPLLPQKPAAPQYFFELMFILLAIAVGITAIVLLIKAYPIITITALAFFLILPFIIWGFDLNWGNYFYYLLLLVAVMGMILIVLGT